MNILQFIFFFGVINIIFGFLWRWIIVLPAAILFSLVRLNFGMWILKLFGIYIIVSLTAILTLGSLVERHGLFFIILYPLIGAFLIFTTLAGSQYEAYKQARQSGDFETVQLIEKESNLNTISFFAAVLFYILVLFVPTISINILSISLLKMIDWIYYLPIIGLIISIGGILFLIKTIFQGIVILAYLIPDVRKKLN